MHGDHATGEVEEGKIMLGLFLPAYQQARSLRGDNASALVRIISSATTKNT
jgi:hypothetical protein